MKKRALFSAYVPANLACAFCFDAKPARAANTAFVHRLKGVHRVPLHAVWRGKHPVLDVTIAFWASFQIQAPFALFHRDLRLSEFAVSGKCRNIDLQEGRSVKLCHSVIGFPLVQLGLETVLRSKRGSLDVQPLHGAKPIIARVTQSRVYHLFKRFPSSIRTFSCRDQRCRQRNVRDAVGHACVYLRNQGLRQSLFGLEAIRAALLSPLPPGEHGRAAP